MKEYLVVITVMSVALAMDAFAIAITLGMDGSANTVRERLKVSTSFGFFQGLLFIVGIISLSFVNGGVTTYNHLIAGTILLILGIRMLKEAFEQSSNQVHQKRDLTFKLLAMFGIATSIDALAAGITYGLIYEQILIATILIAVVAFILSYIGTTFGKTLGHLIGNKASVFGGIMIILLGIEALFS